MIPSALGRLGGVRTVNITSDQTNYNLRTALGSPSGAMRIVVNIASGVSIKSSNRSTPAFDEGSGWAAGTIITVRNSGSILGAGGGGGDGGSAGWVLSGDKTNNTNTSGGTGSAGGAALRLTVPTFVDNASGQIFGGGGGGGGGGGSIAWYLSDSDYVLAHPANGGGGGRGYNAAGGGGRGVVNNYTDFTPPTMNVGYAGSGSSAGAGGTQVIDGTVTVPAGGNGGDWGTAGSNGATTTRTGPEWHIVTASANGSGGAGGKAVDLNGQTLTWISGNDPSRVKGAVS